MGNGVRLDVGHGINFSFATARRMLDGGLEPYTISSDTHGLLSGVHDDSTCSYSLAGTMSKLLGLGMGLSDVVRCATERPATVLGRQDEIGTLAPGSRADLTLLERRVEDWEFVDPLGATLAVEERLVPARVVRAGRPLVPSKRLLRDVCPPEERGEAGRAVAVGGRAR